MLNATDAGLARGHLVTRRTRVSLLLAVILSSVAVGCKGSAARGRATPLEYGGTIITSVRAEPRSFNRYVTRDQTGDVLGYLMHSALVRVNRVTQKLEPELAEQWELLPDGVTYRIGLRQDVRFSDGEAFTADDVVFSFRALYDERDYAVLADSLFVAGKPLAVTAIDNSTVQIRFPAPFAPGLRLIEGIPILPRHRLEAAYTEGKFAHAWRLTTPPGELAGVGPFVLRKYETGQRLLFDRNPFYWRRDEESRPLPRADHLVVEILPDQDTEQLKLIAGELDFSESEIRPADYAIARRAQAEGRLTLHDLGIGTDGDLLWFNLKPAKVRDPRSGWLQQSGFRRAISDAVDRQAFIDTVYLGSGEPASGIVSPANREWFVNAGGSVFDLAQARAELTQLGLHQRKETGVLEDQNGRPVRFSLLTQKGNTSLERGGVIIRESLGHLGIQVDVVAFEVGALVQRLTSGDYDAAYFRLVASDTDPSLNPDFWLSTGSAHVWNPNQKTPATEWEREIDRLMNDIAASSDQRHRVHQFGQVQHIMSREMPVLCFAFPRLWLATSTRISGATPATFRPPLLWNPSVIAVGQPDR